MKKAAIHAIQSFLLCIEKCEMKNVQTLLLFSLATVVYSPSACLYEKKFPYEGGDSIAHSILKLVYSEEKIASVNTNIRSGKSKNAYQIDCRQL